MMNKKLIFVPVLMALVSAALLMTNSAFKWTAHHLSRSDKSGPADDTSDTTWRWTTTTGPPGTNLNRKMFTLSLYGSGVRFYAPYSYGPTPYRPDSTTTRPYTTPSRPYTTPSRPYTTPSRPYSTTRSPYTTNTKPPTTTRHRPSWRPTTTVNPTAGVSVCLRYLSAYQSSINPLFTLSPSSSPMNLRVDFPNRYQLSNPYGYNYVSLNPYIKFWSNIEPEIWTRVCLTVDSRLNVVQLFSGSNMTVRKMLNSRNVWSGERVIDIPGFDGQVTDIQVWDYPLRYKEVFNYMTNGIYVPYRGNVLTWSAISYSPRGSALLEDVYERQANQPINSHRGRDRRPKAGRANREFVDVGESGKRKKGQF